MPDDRRIVKADRRRINLGQAHEVSGWQKALNVSKAQLMTAVNAVGTYAHNIREYFANVPPTEVKVVVKRARKAVKRAAKK